MRIIVAKEKHETRYLNASTEQDLYASALKLLEERYGDIYLTPDEIFGVDKEPELSITQVAMLPEGEVKKLALKQIEEHRDRWQVKEWYNEWYNRVLNVIMTANGKKAWQILLERKNNQYEWVALEDVEMNE